VRISSTNTKERISFLFIQYPYTGALPSTRHRDASTGVPPARCPATVLRRQRSVAAVGGEHADDVTLPLVASPTHPARSMPLSLWESPSALSPATLQARRLAWGRIGECLVDKPIIGMLTWTQLSTASVLRPGSSPKKLLMRAAASRCNRTSLPNPCAL
jgi:hypothetical protein